MNLSKSDESSWQQFCVGNTQQRDTSVLLTMSLCARKTTIFLVRALLSDVSDKILTQSYSSPNSPPCAEHHFSICCVLSSKLEHLGLTARTSVLALAGNVTPPGVLQVWGVSPVTAGPWARDTFLGAA